MEIRRGQPSEEEGRQEHQTNEVKLGQTFTLFPPDHTINEHGGYESTIIVTNGSDTLDFYPALEPVMPQAPAFTPFHPFQGYTLNDYDFDNSDTATYKAKKWMEKTDKSSLDPLLFTIGFMTPDEELYERYKYLRLQLFADRYKLEAQFAFGQKSYVSDEFCITFNKFYPNDSPRPLYLPGSGLDVRIPNDTTAVNSLKGRFYIPDARQRRMA